MEIRDREIWLSPVDVNTIANYALESDNRELFRWAESIRAGLKLSDLEASMDEPSTEIYSVPHSEKVLEVVSRAIAYTASS